MWLDLLISGLVWFWLRAHQLVILVRLFFPGTEGERKEAAEREENDRASDGQASGTTKPWLPPNCDQDDMLFLDKLARHPALQKNLLESDKEARQQSLF